MFFLQNRPDRVISPLEGYRTSPMIGRARPDGDKIWDMADHHGGSLWRTSDVALAGLAAIVAAGVYVAADGLDSAVTRGFVVLAALRVILLGVVLAFGSAVRATGGRLVTIGLLLAALGVAGYVVGAIGGIATDGWTYDALDEDVALPWYLPFVGIGAIVFSVGTVLVGIAGRSAGWPAVALVLSGVAYPLLLFPAQPFGTVAGHLIWLVLWLAFAAGMAWSDPRSRQDGEMPPEER